MIKVGQLLLGILIIVSFSSCRLEKARPFKKQVLLIASDCLYPSDTTLFRSFKKTHKIRIRIIHLPFDSLVTKLKEDGMTTNIDAVILSSVYYMDKLEKSNRLQKIPREELVGTIQNKYHSRSGKWSGIGIDPYIFLTLNDTLKRVRAYKDLLNDTKWCTTLKDDADWYPFYSNIVFKIKPESKYNALDWIKNFSKNNNGLLTDRDSSFNCKVLITYYSVYAKNEIISKTRFAKGKLIFPNQRSGGCYYNMRCMGIIHQARNYSNALKFYNYLLIESVNKRVNNSWKTFPVISTKDSGIIYQNLRFKKNRVSPVNLTQFYIRVRNTIKLIN
jgi:ABC-type Fe3+ transport system substrate-binding protein